MFASTSIDPNRRGAVFMIGAMAAFAVEDTLFKAATHHVPVGLALLIFGGCGALIFACVAVYRRESLLPTGGLTRGLLIRGLFEFIGRLFFGLALAFADLSTTSAILQATPLVVVAGAVVVFGERVGWRRWLAIAIGLLGVMLVLRPDGASLNPTALFAVLGMLGFAGRDLTTRATPQSVTNAQLGVLGYVALTLAGGTVHLAIGTPLAVPATGPALQLIAAAVVGVVAYSSLTAAMRTGDVSVVTPFRYTRLVFALALAMVVFGERPDAMMLLGSALIVGSGVFTLARSGKQPAALN